MSKPKTGQELYQQYVIVCDVEPWVAPKFHALPTPQREFWDKLAITPQTSDGYHTFAELYEHRVSLFIALASQVDTRSPTGDVVWRSRLHSDGTMFDGWFVMGINRVAGEQITYHLPMSRWADTDWLGHEDERAPEWDGHTSSDVLDRLRRYFG